MLNPRCFRAVEFPPGVAGPCNSRDAGVEQEGPAVEILQQVRVQEAGDSAEGCNGEGRRPEARPRAQQGRLVQLASTQG